MINSTKSPKNRFLDVFRGEMQANIIEFGKQLWEKDSDIFIFMARKAACFFDCLRELKIADVRGLAVSDRILDMDLSILVGKKVTLVDDCVFSGTTLYHAREIVLKAGAVQCDTIALTINEDWIRPSLLPGGSEADELNFVQPLFKQNDSQCVQQCFDVVRAISLFPRPYDVDFPHTLTSKISNDDLDHLLHCSGWQAYDVSTNYQIAQGVRAFTLIPDLHIQHGFMDEYKGLSANIQVAKVRLYVKMLSSNSWSIRLVPIIMLGAMQSSALKGKECVFGKELEDELETLGAVSPRSRYRLLHFLVSWALLRRFVKVVNDQIGLRIEERLRYDLAEMSFGSKFASISANVLELMASVSFPPPAHEPDSPIIAQYGCNVKNVETPQELVSACLEPFIWLYKNLEIPARKLVIEKGLKACIDDDHNNLTRLRRGFSPQRLIERLHSVSFNVVRYVSLFLDKAIDLGIAVPTMVDEGGVLYRALRHGEDAVFGEAEERLSVIALEVYMTNRGISCIYGLELQKFIVLFTQIAVRDGSLLERLNTSESVNIGCRVISIKGYLHGPVPMVTTLDESGTVGAPFVQGNDYPAEWLINHWEAKGILSVEKSGSKQFSVADFKDAMKFVKKLKLRKDGISKYIYLKLDHDTQSKIDAWQSASQPTDELQNALIDNINRIASRESIWNAETFKKINLRSITERALRYSKPKNDTFRVNRLLIEDAFSKAFIRSIGGTKYSIKKVPDLKIGIRKESQARKIGRCLGRVVGDLHTNGSRPLNNDTDLVLLSTCSEAEHQIRALSGELSIILERWSGTISKVRDFAREKEYSEASEILLKDNSLFIAINSGAMKYMWFTEQKLTSVIAAVAKYADTIDSSGELRDEWNLLWPEFVSPSNSNTATETWGNIKKMGQWLITTSVTIRIINYWLVLNAEEQNQIKSEEASDVLTDCKLWCDNFFKYCSEYHATPIGEVASQFKNKQNQQQLHAIGEQCKIGAAYMNDVGKRAIRHLLSDSKLLCERYGAVGAFRPFPYAVFIDIEMEEKDLSIDPFARQLSLTSDLIGDGARFIENSHNPWRVGLWILVRGNKNATNAVELCHKLVSRCNTAGLRYRAVVLGQLSYEDSIRDMAGSVKLAEGDFFRRIADLRTDVLPASYNNKVVVVNEITAGSLSEGQKYCNLSEQKSFDVRIVKSGSGDLPEKTFLITEVIASLPKTRGKIVVEEINMTSSVDLSNNKPFLVQQIFNKEVSMGDSIHQYGLGDNTAGDKVMGDKIGTQINNSQDLLQASKDIKALLAQLSLDYPSDSNRVLGAKAIDQVEKNPDLKSRLLRGVKAGGFAALEKLIDHPVAQFFIVGAKEVLKP